MTPDAILDVIIRGSYLLLAVVTLIGLIRHRDTARLDIALPFLALGVTVSIAALRDAGITYPILSIISPALLIPLPYFFMRMLKHFYAVPRAIELAAIVAIFVFWVALIVFPPPLPGFIGAAVALYFLLAEGYTSVAFVGVALQRRGVTRSQLLLIALGSFLFTLIILLAGVGAALPRVVPSGPITRIGAILTALSYYLGFSSPRWLRRIWQRTELYHFLQGSAQLNDLEQQSEAVAFLSQFALQTVGGQAAQVALWDGGKNALVLHDTNGKASGKLLTLDNDNIITRGWKGRKALASTKLADFGPEFQAGAAQVEAGVLYVVPVAYAGQAFGVLLVLLRGALFPEDDLDMLTLLATQQASALRYLEVIGKLQYERDLMTALMDNIPDTIYFKDIESRFTRINQAQTRVLGVSKPEDAAGKTDLDFQSAELARPFMEEEQQIIKTARPLINREEYNPTPDGKPRWFSATKVPLKDPTGNVIGIVGVSRDITQNKVSEEKINELNKSLTERAEELEAANKELEAFSYSVSHDLRAPLRAVDGFSRIVIEEYGPQLPEEGQRYLRLVREGAQQMGHLIDDLLSFSRLGRQPMKSQPVVTADLVREVYESLTIDRDGRKIEFNVGDLPSCRGDLALIRQVLANLLGNALKFTREREIARIDVGSNASNGDTVYFVKDNGAGFDMKYSDKLFGVFQRLHRVDEYEGTGVGLATVQRIINRHGGRIWAEAAVDQGATFYFTLREDGSHNE